MISKQETQAKFNEYHEAQVSHDEVYTDGSKTDEIVGAAVVINRHFQNGETTCTIFTAEATAIGLALNYHQHMGPVHHDVVVYSDSMSCSQAIEGEDTENPLICHIMNLVWLLSDKGTRACFCWIPSHCGIEGKWKSGSASTIDPRPKYKPTGKCPLYRYEATDQLLHSAVGSSKWDAAVHGRDFYLVKPTMGPP